jgi:hypothetical protein
VEKKRGDDASDMGSSSEAMSPIYPCLTFGVHSIGANLGKQGTCRKKRE